MSRNFKLTHEEINKVLMRSPYALPSSPGQVGLDATQIKKYFYDFIRVLAESLNVHFEDINLSMSELDDIISQINERLNNVGSGDTENGGTEGEGGTSTEALEEHNVSESAHTDIRDEINVVRAIGTQALNIARGKNRIQLFTTLEKMFEFIDSHRYYEDYGYASYESIEEGDIFVIAQKNVPEFAVLALSRYEDENAQDITESDISTKEFLAGGIYYYTKKDITLVGIEGGADTSSIIDTTQVQKEISKHDESTLAHQDIRKEILQKQDKLKAGNNITISNDGTISATLEVSADGTIDVSSKLDKVTNTTELPQAYIKNADGTQGLIDIVVSNYVPNDDVLVTGRVITNELNVFAGLTDTTYATKEELEAKQDKLTFDDKPREDSPNSITSGGVYAEFKEFSIAYDVIIGNAKTECKSYTDEQIGDIEATLDSIIAIQNSLIGGDSV